MNEVPQESLKLYQSRRYVDAFFLTMALKIQKHDMENLSFFTILKGGIYTSCNVLKNISWPKKGPIFGYLGLASYGASLASEDRMDVTYDADLLESMIEGRNVWIIDDISDTGKTLDYAKGLIGTFKPKTIRTAVLVDKKEKREIHSYPEPDIVGVACEGDKFLVGCGLGFGEKYRHLRELYELVLE